MTNLLRKTVIRILLLIVVIPIFIFGFLEELWQHTNAKYIPSMFCRYIDEYWQEFKVLWNVKYKTKAFENNLEKD